MSSARLISASPLLPNMIGNNRPTPLPSTRSRLPLPFPFGLNPPPLLLLPVVWKLGARSAHHTLIPPLPRGLPPSLAASDSAGDLKAAASLGTFKQLPP